MAKNLLKAIELEPDNPIILVYGAIAFHERGWGNRRKKHMFKKYGSDGTPVGLSDKEYSMKLVERATKIFESKGNLSVIEEEMYEKLQMFNSKYKRWHSKFKH